MTRFHINKNGVPAPCHAKPGNCPLGGDDQHFGTKEEAEAFSSALHQQTYGLLGVAEKNPKHEIDRFERLEKLVDYAGVDSVMSELYHSMSTDEIVDFTADFVDTKDAHHVVADIQDPYEKFEALVDTYGEEVIEEAARWLPEDNLHETIDHIEKTLNMDEYYLEFNEVEFEQITNPTVEDRILNLRGKFGTKGFIDRIAVSMDSSYIADFNEFVIQDYGISDYVDEEDTPEEQLETIVRFVGEDKIVKDLADWMPEPIMEAKVAVLERFV